MQFRFTQPDQVSNNPASNYKPSTFLPGRTPCSICGKPIMQLSTDEKERAYEIKWKVHLPCQKTLINMIDRETHPGGNRGNR